MLQIRIQMNLNWLLFHSPDKWIYSLVMTINQRGSRHIVISPHIFPVSLCSFLYLLQFKWLATGGEGIIHFYLWGCYYNYYFHSLNIYQSPSPYLIIKSASQLLIVINLLVLYGVLLIKIKIRYLFQVSPYAIHWWE